MVQHLRHRELTLLCLEMKRAAGSSKRGGGAWKTIIKDFKQGLGRDTQLGIVTHSWITRALLSTWEDDEISNLFQLQKKGFLIIPWPEYPKKHSQPSKLHRDSILADRYGGCMISNKLRLCWSQPDSPCVWDRGHWQIACNFTLHPETPLWANYGTPEKCEATPSSATGSDLSMCSHDT
ncbi:hypothetical protein Anapl_16971 [Anas platyrhynchos]|uniref:Uncharacterized protein n=1 Tax=Anas platyrhynchos TaxID=8839 RepID=R0LMY8_ANAPL|nr:hypothetical protein Anapl_16971 [Anas platyrhynchos]